MNYDVGHRHGLDLALLRLWYRPMARAQIRPLAWEAPYALGAALRKTKDKTTTTTKKLSKMSNKARILFVILHVRHMTQTILFR